MFSEILNFQLVILVISGFISSHIKKKPFSLHAKACLHTLKSSVREGNRGIGWQRGYTWSSLVRVGLPMFRYHLEHACSVFGTCLQDQILILPQLLAPHKNQFSSPTSSPPILHISLTLHKQFVAINLYSCVEFHSVPWDILVAGIVYWVLLSDSPQVRHGLHSGILFSFCFHCTFQTNLYVL